MTGAAQAPRYRARPGDHVVWLNYKDATHPLCGGAEEYMHQVARRLVGEGQRVTLLTARSRGVPAVDTVDGVVIRRMGSLYTVYLLALVWLWRNRRAVDAIIDTCNGIPFFSPLAVGRRVPVVVLIHHVHQTMFAQHFRFPVAQIGRWVERVGNRWVYGRRTIAVVSPSSRAEVRRVLGLRGPVFVAANGQEPLSVAGAARSPAPRIVCVGRLAPHKRWDVLLRALPPVVAADPAVRLDLVGDGPCRDRLTALAAELGLGAHVTFHGRLDDAARNRLLASAWLTVSTSEVEGWGLAVTEAMSLGVPAVALAVPGLRDSVRHNDTGWVVDGPERLPERLSDALRQLADPTVAAHWAQRCRRWSRRFTWDATADRIVSLLLAEQGRLTAPERRRACDISTVVEMSLDQAAAFDFTRLRSVDQVDWDEAPRAGGAGTRVRLLLAGFDESDTVVAMSRLGLRPRFGEPRVWMARPADLLGWRRSAGPRGHDLRQLFGRLAAPPVSRADPKESRNVDEQRAATTAGGHPRRQ